MTKDFLSYNERHRSNNKETLRLIDSILLPHIEKIKKDLSLPNDQKSLIIWNAFTGQNTDAVKNRLSGLKILTVNVPKNLTHLLQLLDLTASAIFKNIERKEFSNYFTSSILKELIKDRNLDVTTISIELRLTTLEPIHFETLKKILSFFDTEDGKKIIISGFRSAGICQAIEKARAGEHSLLNPCL